MWAIPTDPFQRPKSESEPIWLSPRWNAEKHLIDLGMTPAEAASVVALHVGSQSQMVVMDANFYMSAIQELTRGTLRRGV